MTIDPWILAFSFVTVAGTVWLGFWSAKKSRTASDFFVAGRSVSVGWNASAISGEYLSAASFMGIAGMVMSSGYDALWYPVCYACGYLFLLLFIAGPLRRFGAYTIPDFAEGRYDSPVFRKIAVVFVLFIGFFYTMPQMKGAGTTLAYIFPGLPYWAGVVLVGAVITLNVALGGMKGITLVQAIQYWAKMFAISVPIFILMAVYGDYGKQLGRNGIQSQPVHRPENIAWTETTYATWGSQGNWISESLMKFFVWKQRRFPNPANWHFPPAPPTPRFTIQSLLNDCMQVSGKHYFMPVEITTGTVDFSHTNTLDGAQFMAAVEQVLQHRSPEWWNGGTQRTERGNLAFIQQDAKTIYVVPQWIAATMTNSVTELDGRNPLPDKAPADATWLSPFGPFTTKAAKAANASIRWNFSPKIRGALEDIGGRPPLQGWRALVEKAGKFIDRLRTKPSPPRTSQFADWTNMPTNMSRTLSGGFSMLGTLREYGLLAERPVFVATNLPRHKLDVISGSFQTKAQFLNYLDALFLTNGVRLIMEPGKIKALAAADWETYQKTPEKLFFVPDLSTSMHANVKARVLAFEYGRIAERNDEDDLNVLLATNLPDKTLDFNPGYETLLAQEARDGMVKILAENGITLLHPRAKEVWAIPTTELARYQLPPVNVRALSLLYTYSLIIALVCGTAGLPHILVRFYTNPDGRAAKRTTMWVMILIGVFYLFPPVFGVMGRNLLPELYSGVGAKGTDKIVLELPRILNEHHAPLGSILSGITCAGAFAAFMSTFSGLLVSMTGALAHDVYGRMLRPKSTPEQRMRMFKIAAILLGAGAIVAGTFVEQFQINFMVGQAFAIAAASYFPLLFMSAWWRGMTMKGAASGMLGGGLLALAGISLTSFTDLKWLPLAHFWELHPLLRILCEQPAIWTVPLAILLMIAVSKLTAHEIPADVRMKMLVLHAPEGLGLKQEYIQEHQGTEH